MARVLIPLPDHDFDVTEVAVPCRVLRNAGHDLVFATEESGTLPAADPLLAHRGALWPTRGRARTQTFLSRLDRGARYLNARWPSDAYAFARRFAEMLATG
jgi:putative intracellular protease/amidase